MPLVRAAVPLAVALALAACSSPGGAPRSDIPDPDLSPTPLAVAETSADPGDLPTNEPTDAPTVNALPVKITKATKAVKPGASASVTVTTRKGAKCSIAVEYESGRSTAKGLGDKKADANGKVSWSWFVGRKANPQAVAVSVRCTLSGHTGDAKTSVTVK